MVEVDQPCHNLKWRYCVLTDGVCKNCERGRSSIALCNNKDYRVCNFDISASFKDGICINCGKVSCSAKTVIGKIHDMINLYPDNFELFSDLGDIVRENNVQLTTNEIRDICQFYFKRAKQTRKRLDEADELFRTLDHANISLINPINVIHDEPTMSIGYVDGDQQ